MGGGLWVLRAGDDAVPSRRQEASVVLSARRAEEVTQEGLSRALAQMAPTAAPARRVPPPRCPGAGGELGVPRGGGGGAHGDGDQPGGHLVG